LVVEQEILDLTLELDNARGAELLFQFVRDPDRLVADRSDEALDALTALPVSFIKHRSAGWTIIILTEFEDGTDDILWCALRARLWGCSQWASSVFVPPYIYSAIIL